MIVFIVTFLLALATIGMWYGLVDATPQMLLPVQTAFSGEHLIFFILAGIFFIFVVVTCFIVIKGQLEKERAHRKESE